jgi:anthranilate synthase/aminodeoxychorismate synthase-like glutamine amidotransferase
MILVIDNYDSFTYNLVDMLLCYQQRVMVYKNDQITLEMIKMIGPSAILISPGPGSPNDAGICLDLVKKCYKDIPILGICLGHQVIAQAFGGNIVQAKNLLHGKTDSMIHNGKDIFYNVSQEFIATRYHSLIVEDSNLTKELEVVARSKSDNTIMAIKHVEYPLLGLQFHPESYLTKEGRQIIENFIDYMVVGGKNV